MKKRNELLEELADLEHNRWSQWMLYLFSLSTLNADGSVTIPMEKVVRWRRQSMTEYEDLTEKEKESDRREARKSLSTCVNFIIQFEE